MQCETIIGSLVRQLVSDLPAKGLRKLDRKKPLRTDIVDFVRNILSDEHRYFIVLDGLDECEEGQMMEVIEGFHDLFASSSPPVKIFLSSRPRVPSWLPRKFQAEQRIILDSGENRNRLDTDIEAFISATLADWLSGESPELQIGSPATIHQICERLTGESDGM